MHMVSYFCWFVSRQLLSKTRYLQLKELDIKNGLCSIVNECTFKRCFITDSLLCKPLIRVIEFCFLHAKLVTKSGKEILVEREGSG